MKLKMSDGFVPSGNIKCPEIKCPECAGRIQNAEIVGGSTTDVREGLYRCAFCGTLVKARWRKGMPKGAYMLMDSVVPGWKKRKKLFKYIDLFPAG